jgi:hypothetical protein
MIKLRKVRYVGQVNGTGEMRNRYVCVCVCVYTHTQNLVRKTEEIDHWEDIVTDGRIILKLILWILWNKFIWLGTPTGGGFLNMARKFRIP